MSGERGRKEGGRASVDGWATFAVQGGRIDSPLALSRPSFSWSVAKQPTNRSVVGVVDFPHLPDSWDDDAAEFRIKERSSGARTPQRLHTRARFSGWCETFRVGLGNLASFEKY